MNFISAEEFLKQSEKVQRVLQNHWIKEFEKTTDDLIILNWNGENTTYQSILSKNHSFNVEDCIPLLQMHQLISFLEEKTKCKIEISCYKGKGYEFYLYSYPCELSEREYKYDPFSYLGFELLEALWKVACEIATKG